MLDKPDKNKQIIWDLYKIEIKELSIKYGINWSKTRKDGIQKLEKKTYWMSDKKWYKASEIARRSVRNPISTKTYGTQIRSRIKWIESGEKSTKYFLNLEKSRQTKKSIINLYDSNGNLLTNQDEILNRGK